MAEGRLLALRGIPELTANDMAVLKVFEGCSANDESLTV